MNPNSKTQFYMDVLIAETLLGDTGLSKVASPSGWMADIVSKVKDYFSNKVDPNDKAGSVLNMLAPGAIAVTFGAMGLPWFGRFLGLAASFFHWDVASILEEIWNKLKQALHSGSGQVTSNQVHQIVESSVQGNQPAQATEEEADEAARKVQQGQDKMQEANDGFSVSSQLRAAKLLRLAMESEFINKEAASKKWFSLFSSRKSGTGNMLTSILSLLFRVALTSAGLMVAGDVMRKWLGMDEHFGGDPKSSVKTAPQPSGPNETVRNSETESWVENIHNDQNSIQQMLLQFAHQLYPQLSGKDSQILNDPKFQYLVHTISWYNHDNPGSPIVYIPRMFTTKKQLVDSFASDIQANG